LPQGSTATMFLFHSCAVGLCEDTDNATTFTV